jgi:transposase
VVEHRKVKEPGTKFSSDVFAYTTCYNSFVRWRKTGVWDHVLDQASKAFDGDMVMIDTSSCVRVHQHAATAKRGIKTKLAYDVPVAA